MCCCVLQKAQNLLLEMIWLKYTHTATPLLLILFQKALLNLGVRHAEAGEFTRAALLNNKIDLIQAESLLSLINAKSITGVQISNTNLTGSLTKRFKKMRELLIKTLGLLEYELDISETDNQKEISNQALKSLKKIHKKAPRQDIKVFVLYLKKIFKFHTF